MGNLSSGTKPHNPEIWKPSKNHLPTHPDFWQNRDSFGNIFLSQLEFQENRTVFAHELSLIVKILPNSDYWRFFWLMQNNHWLIPLKLAWICNEKFPPAYLVFDWDEWKSTHLWNLGWNLFYNKLFQENDCIERQIFLWQQQMFLHRNVLGCRKRRLNICLSCKQFNRL